MAVEMPERVAAALGADEVTFPWFRAGEAVAALNVAASALAAQGEGRGQMALTLADWQGGYRAQFDLAYHDVISKVAGLQELLLLRAGGIADAALDANALQLARNSAVDA